MKQTFIDYVYSLPGIDPNTKYLICRKYTDEKYDALDEEIDELSKLSQKK